MRITIDIENSTNDAQLATVEESAPNASASPPIDAGAAPSTTIGDKDNALQPEMALQPETSEAIDAGGAPSDSASSSQDAPSVDDDTSNEDIDAGGAPDFG